MTPVEHLAEHNPHFDLEDELREILGRVCFQCADIAGLLRASGFKVDRKAEDEQAVCIHFLLRQYFIHGPKNWKAEAEKELKSLQRELIARRDAEQAALNTNTVTQ